MSSEPTRNEQFLFEVDVAWLVFSDFPEQSRKKKGEIIPFDGKDTFAIVIPVHDVEVVKSTIARIMDENHGADVDTPERYIKKHWNINGIRYLRKVRL